MIKSLSREIIARSRLIWASFRSLPLWVQIWVAAILVPVNAYAFLMLDTPAGRWTAVAALFVVATNLPIMAVYCGMNRAMSIPHLIAWIPLEIFLVRLLLKGGIAFSDPGFLFTAAVLAVNGISLVFDAADSWRWWRGERETPGIQGMVTEKKGSIG